jgi:uncharacterized protein
MSSKAKIKEEESFFAKQELERKMKRMKEQRSKLDAEEKQKLKELHHMRCPKCGAKLAEISYKDILIEKCISCQGVWFDVDELDRVTKGENSFLSNMLKIFN